MAANSIQITFVTDSVVPICLASYAIPVGKETKNVEAVADRTGT